MFNNDEYSPTSYKDYLAHLVYYANELTDSLLNYLENEFDFYYAYDIKDSNEDLDIDDFETVYKKCADDKYQEISDEEYKKAAFKIYDIIPGCIYDWMVDFFFCENDNVEESNQTLLNNFPEIKEAHMERAWYSETYNTIREHQLFDMKDFPKL